ncbi:hypothetical protein DUT90_05740 [Polaribacter sp. WD7]|nr:hypothetical protein DUT90_05740 [Polaribacter sp. WD7]
MISLKANTQNLRNKLSKILKIYKTSTNVEVFLILRIYFFGRYLSGQAFRYNLFAVTTQKGFPLQSLTQLICKLLVLIYKKRVLLTSFFLKVL